METELNNLFINIRNDILKIIQEKNVDIDILALDLGINRRILISNLRNGIENFTFYLKALTLLEHWEV